MAKKLSSNPAVRKLLRLVADSQKLLSQYEKDMQKAGIRKQELNNIRAGIEIHDTAIEMDCVNPDLLYQALETDLKVEDFDGELCIEFMDKSTGKPRLDPRTEKPMTVQGRISEARYSQDLACLFAEKPSPSSLSKYQNPWKKGDSFNLTLQGQITKQNPALAERLKREAND